MRTIAFIVLGTGSQHGGFFLPHSRAEFQLVARCAPWESIWSFSGGASSPHNTPSVPSSSYGEYHCTGRRTLTDRRSTGVWGTAGAPAGLVLAWSLGSAGQGSMLVCESHLRVAECTGIVASLSSNNGCMSACVCCSLPLPLPDVGNFSVPPRRRHRWSACRFYTVPSASCTPVDDELVAAPTTAGTHLGPDLKFLAQTVSPTCETGSLLAAELLRTFCCNCPNCTLLRKSGFSKSNAFLRRRPVNSSAGERPVKAWGVLL